MGTSSLVVLDSNCLSYLLDGLYTVAGPTGSLADQQLALVRIMLYDEWGFYVTPKVVKECGRIRDNVRAALHESWLSTLISETQPIEPSTILARATHLQQWHGDPDDCRIVAKCEDASVPVLLTYDNDFIAHLRGQTTVSLMRPTEYWKSLNIAKGTKPRTQPHDTNPLSTLKWWRWN